MEDRGIPTLPYDVLDLQCLLSTFPIRDRTLRLLFPYDIRALYRALDWNLSAEEDERYSHFWYDDAGVSFASRSSLASLTNTAYSSPYYYGNDVITELPAAAFSWLDNNHMDPSQPFYSRFNIEGQASVGSINFIIEVNGNCFRFTAGVNPSTMFRVWVRNEHLGKTETKMLSWMTSESCDHQRAAKEILDELRMVLRYMYEEKHHSLFFQDIK